MRGQSSVAVEKNKAGSKLTVRSPGDLGECAPFLLITAGIGGHAMESVKVGARGAAFFGTGR